MDKRALILVDLQNDFLPGGALGVAGGDEVIPVANRLMENFPLIAATRDWHPANHGSFAASHPGRKLYEVIDLHGLPQVLWPVHCVQDTPGADFSAELDTPRLTRVFSKGTRPEVDSYSGLYDNGRDYSTGLGEWLRGQGVGEITVCGIATDYCVKFTVLDALRDGFRVTLHRPGCRAVNLQPGDEAEALEEMRAAGAQIEE